MQKMDWGVMREHRPIGSQEKRAAWRKSKRDATEASDPLGSSEAGTAP